MYRNNVHLLHWTDFASVIMADNPRTGADKSVSLQTDLTR